MAKIKTAMMEGWYNEGIQGSQAELWNGAENTDLGYLGLSPWAGLMTENGNNSSSPSEMKKEESSVSKPKTLIFNERAKRNTTTQETNPYIAATTPLNYSKEQYALMQRWMMEDALQRQLQANAKNFQGDIHEIEF